MTLKDIFSNIEKTEQLPVVFAGSGITKRYTTNKYNWKELLIECISAYTENAVNKYKEYETLVTYKLSQREPNNKFSLNEAIGTEVEKDFNVAYYKGEIKNLQVPTDQNPLKSYIAKLLSSYSIDENMKEEIQLLKNLQSKMLTVVTTNYDNFFEDHIFSQHEKIIGQDIFSKSEIGTLFKIHGCVTKPNSIIITNNDYKNFKRKRRILSAKLISLFTENPVIFLGYSLQDENIKAILTDIFICLDDNDELLLELEKRLIMVNYDENVDKVIIGNHSLILDDGVFINLTKITLSSYEPLLEEMQSLTRKIKFKEIKLIEDLVYDVVHSKEGARTKVINMVDENADSDDIILALTKKDHILSEFGIIGLTRDRLFEDLIYNNVFNEANGNQETELKILLEQQMKNILLGNAALPIHKYLAIIRNEQILQLDEKIETLKNKSAEDYYNSSIKKDKQTFPDFNFNSFQEILMNANVSFSRQLNFLVLYAVEKAKAEEIREFLINHADFIHSGAMGSTYFRKLACIFDIKKYKSA